MAQKKFSRLSVLLEARDKMSSTFIKAANSSERLSQKIRQLDNSVSKSKSSVVNAHVQTRVLQDGYRQLAQQLGQTSEKTNIFANIFDKLPKKVKLAAYYLEGYYKSLKIISVPMDYLVSKTAQFATTTLKAIKTTKGYEVFSKVVDNLNFKMKLLALSAELSVGEAKKIVTGTKAWKAFDIAVSKTKKGLQSAHLSFNLWKNSSKAVESTKNAFNLLLSPVKKLGNLLNLTKRDAQDANKNLGNLGSRRSTFNQLADANARLNKQLTQMNDKLARANRGLSSMRASMGSLNGMGAAFTAMYTAQAGMQIGQNVATDTVGYAMEQQYSSASVGILAGPENGAKYYKQIQDYAAQTAYSTEDWARSMRGAISKSKTVEELEKYQIVIEQLATLDPMQGLEGAALAVRELNSGDSVSLQERFELPKSAMKELRAIEDPIKQIEKLSEVIGRETGYTVENIQNMKKLPLMQFEKAKNIWKTMKGYMGEETLKVITPYIKQFNEAWDSGKFDNFIAKTSKGMASFVEGTINLVKGSGSIIDSIKTKFTPLGTLFSNVAATVSQAWPNVKTILSNVATVAMGLVTIINNNWPTINSLLQKGVELVKTITTWIADNWQTLLPIVMGVLGAFAGFKIFSIISTLVGKAKDVFKLLSTAVSKAGGIFKWVFTLLRANPIGIVVTIVFALVSALVTAYNTSDTFREKVQAAWTWIKDVGAAAVEIGKAAIEGLTDAVKSATSWIGSMWDKFSNFVSDVKNTKINWSAILPGGKSFIDFGGKQAKADGKHHGGISNIPHDNYKAILHKGERVLTRSENKEYEKGSGQPLITGNQFIIREEADIDKVASALFIKIQGAREAKGRV